MPRTVLVAGIVEVSMRPKGAENTLTRLQATFGSSTVNDVIQNSGWCRWRIRCKSGRIHIVSSSLTSPPNFAVTPSAQRAVLVKCCDAKSALRYSRGRRRKSDYYVQLQRPIKNSREAPSASRGCFNYDLLERSQVSPVADGKKRRTVRPVCSLAKVEQAAVMGGYPGLGHSVQCTCRLVPR